MVAIDHYFSDLVAANPQLRVRVANPDEMRSNRMNLTLDRIKHRVLDVELDVAEAVQGGVITALNEEAVVSAVLANKQGLNIAISYEAFAVNVRRDASRSHFCTPFMRNKSCTAMVKRAYCG